MIVDWAPDRVVVEIRAADAAARAARAVPGVVRLQPGVWGLLGRFAGQAWTAATGRALPDIAGVDATCGHDGRLHVEVRLVVDGGYRAAAVGAAVRRSVRSAVAAEVDGPLGGVLVRIVGIDLSADRG